MSTLHASIPRSRFRRWAIFTLIGVLLSLGALAGFVFVIDPFQHYRMATTYTPIADRKIQTYINPGIARHYPYDTLCLGSSMTENTRTSAVQAALGGDPIQLAYRGGSLTNFSVAMRAAFDTHQLQRVILCLDDYTLTDSVYFSPTALPFYLYDKNPFNDVYYLFNTDVLLRIRDLYAYNGYSFSGKNGLDLDMLYNWSGKMIYGKDYVFGMVSFWDTKEVKQYPARDDQPRLQANLDAHLLPFIQAHPETEFIFYYPPYSVLHMYHARLMGQLERRLYNRSYLAEALLAYPNVRLFDFQANREWIENYDLYTDFTHYSGDVNDALTACMGEGQFEVHSVADVQANNAVLSELTYAFTRPTDEELATYRAGMKRQVQEWEKLR